MWYVEKRTTAEFNHSNRNNIDSININVNFVNLVCISRREER